MTPPLETGFLPTTPVSDNLVRQFLANQAALNAHVATVTGGRAEHHDDVDLATTVDNPVPYLNQAVLRRPLTGPGDPVLDRVSAFLTGAPTATVLSVWPTPDLTDRGWVLVGHPMFVARPPGRLTDHEAPGVVVAPVDDVATLAVAERVVVDGYPVEPARGRPPGTVLPAATLGGPLQAYLGSYDGEPVAAAARHVTHGVVNLCLAATLPAARRRGVWRALVVARTADRPDLPAAAFTSDDSRPGFVAMGFLPVFRFTMWLVPGA